MKERHISRRAGIVNGINVDRSPTARKPANIPIARWLQDCSESLDENPPIGPAELLYHAEQSQHSSSQWRSRRSAAWRRNGPFIPSGPQPVRAAVVVRAPTCPKSLCLPTRCHRRIRPSTVRPLCSSILVNPSRTWLSFPEYFCMSNPRSLQFCRCI